MRSTILAVVAVVSLIVALSPWVAAQQTPIIVTPTVPNPPVFPDPSNPGDGLGRQCVRASPTWRACLTCCRNACSSNTCYCACTWRCNASPRPGNPALPPGNPGVPPADTSAGLEGGK